MTCFFNNVYYFKSLKNANSHHCQVCMHSKAFHTLQVTMQIDSVCRIQADSMHKIKLNLIWCSNNHPLGIYPHSSESYNHAKTWTPVIMAAVFIIFLHWKKSFLSIWIERLWNIYSDVKANEPSTQGICINF